MQALGNLATQDIWFETSWHGVTLSGVSRRTLRIVKRGFSITLSPWWIHVGVICGEKPLESCENSKDKAKTFGPTSTVLEEKWKSCIPCLAIRDTSS